jgi:hypothetical protein
MTLTDALASGYKVLSGPYRMPHEERLMLSAKTSLGATEHKVVTDSKAWWIVRLHMVDLDEPPPRPKVKVKIFARIPDDLDKSLRGLARKAHKGNFSAALVSVIDTHFSKCPTPSPSPASSRGARP